MQSNGRVRLRSKGPVTLKVDDPEAVERELERIRRLGGGMLTPQRVVKESEDPGSPLHDEFEWDDSIAGERYREQQARIIIQAVEIVTDGGDSVRAYYHVVVDEQPGYLPVSEVVAREELKERVLAEILRGIVQARKRLSDFEGYDREKRLLDRALAGLTSKSSGRKARRPAPAPAPV